MFRKYIYQKCCLLKKSCAILLRPLFHEAFFRLEIMMYQLPCKPCSSSLISMAYVMMCIITLVHVDHETRELLHL